jgi:hypothetical protein
MHKRHLPTRVKRLLQSKRLPRNPIQPPDFDDITQAAKSHGIHLAIRRIAGKGTNPDHAAIYFKQHGWNLATWYASNGHLAIGPVDSNATSLQDAWSQVAVYLK